MNFWHTRAVVKQIKDNKKRNNMNLYRVVVLQPGTNTNFERGVWADKVEIQGGSILFLTTDDYTQEKKLVGLYPAQSTIITNIETKEEYDKRKGNS